MTFNEVLRAIVALDPADFDQLADAFTSTKYDHLTKVELEAKLAELEQSK